MSEAYRHRLASLTDEEFLRHWKACESALQLARRLGVTASAVQMRVRRMRRRGVVLPKQESSW